MNWLLIRLTSQKNISFLIFITPQSKDLPVLISALYKDKTPQYLQIDVLLFLVALLSQLEVILNNNNFLQ